MKSTSQIFTFLSIIFFYSNSFSVPFTDSYPISIVTSKVFVEEKKIETPEQKKEKKDAKVKKICLKLKGYKKFIQKVIRMMHSYYRLGQDMKTTYAHRFEVDDYASPERCKILEAHKKFQETEVTLIDEELLPSLKGIKKSIKTLLKQIEETPDEEKDIYDYTKKKSAIRRALCITLQNVEKYILQIAGVVGVGNDFMSQIGDFIGLTSKSNYSPYISPERYFRAMWTLTDEIKDKIEESVLVNSNLNPVQKLLISTKGFFNHPVFEQLNLYWTLASLLMELAGAYYNKNDEPQNFSLSDLLGTEWNNLGNKKTPYSVMSKNTSVFLDIVGNLVKSGKLSQLGLASFTTAEKSLKELDTTFSALYNTLTTNNDNLSRKDLLNLLRQNASKDTVKQMKKHVAEVNSLKKDLYTHLNQEKNSLKAILSKSMQRDERSVLEDLIARIEALTATKKNTYTAGKDLAEELIQKNLYSFKGTVYQMLSDTITYALFLKKIVTYGAVIITTLQKIHNTLEKIFFPDEKSKAYLSRAIHSNAKFEKKQRERLKKLTFVDQVFKNQIIGWEKIKGKVQEQLNSFINPLTPERRDKKNLFRPLLITGQPGNGKTMTVMSLITKCNSLGIPSFNVTSHIIKDFEAFVDMLKQEQFAVVVIDELQRIIKDKPYFQTVLLAALTELTDKVWFVLAANKLEDLPEDLWRRCDRLECGLPKQQERLEALNRHLRDSKHTCAPGIEELFLCYTEGMNFNDVFNILGIASTVLHKQRQTQITEKALKEGIKLVYSYKLQAIPFDPRLSRDELLDEFAHMPYSVFEQCIEEWSTVKKDPLSKLHVVSVLSKEEINSTLAKHGYSRLPADPLVAAK